MTKSETKDTPVMSPKIKHFVTGSLATSALFLSLTGFYAYNNPSTPDTTQEDLEPIPDAYEDVIKEELAKKLIQQPAALPLKEGVSELKALTKINDDYHILRATFLKANNECGHFQAILEPSSNSPDQQGKSSRYFVCPDDINRRFRYAPELPASLNQSIGENLYELLSERPASLPLVPFGPNTEATKYNLHVQSGKDGSIQSYFVQATFSGEISNCPGFNVTLEKIKDNSEDAPEMIVGQVAACPTP